MPTYNKVDMLNCAAGHHDFSDDSDECRVCGHVDAVASVPLVAPERPIAAKCAFLDLSTAHLSADARAWLMAGSTLNHASLYHGTGTGAAMSTLGATLNGWFMRAPEDTPERSIYGMPADLQALCDYARAHGCNYILFDADADIIPGLPILDGAEAEMPAEPDSIAAIIAKATANLANGEAVCSDCAGLGADPASGDVGDPCNGAGAVLPAAEAVGGEIFDYLEIRACFEHGGATMSFLGDPTADEYAFHTPMGALDAVEKARIPLIADGENPSEIFWTVYGVAGATVAIGDFKSFGAALDIVNATIAPMAKARDEMDWHYGDDIDALRAKLLNASATLNDFINQCSNGERL